MFFFQDEKDKLRQELDTINRRLENAFSSMRYHRDLIAELEAVIKGYSSTHPHGVRKDGTPRAKPGRKQKGVQA
jgi:hypothetical protein